MAKKPPRARSERASQSSPTSDLPARVRGRPSVPVRERDWPEVRRKIEEERRTQEAKLLVYKSGAQPEFVRASDFETVIRADYSSPSHALLRGKDGGYYLRRSGAYELRAISDEDAALRLWRHSPDTFPEELRDALLRAKSRAKTAPPSSTGAQASEARPETVSEERAATGRPVFRKRDYSVYGWLDGAKLERAIREANLSTNQKTAVLQAHAAYNDPLAREYERGEKKEGRRTLRLTQETLREIYLTKHRDDPRVEDLDIFRVRESEGRGKIIDYLNGATPTGLGSERIETPKTRDFSRSN